MSGSEVQILVLNQTGGEVKMGMVMLSGLFGGILRGVAGIAKDLAIAKKVTINWAWFLISLVVSAIVGMFAGFAIQMTLTLGPGENFLFAILAGYAGADFIETLYKMKLKNRFKLDLEKKMGRLKVGSKNSLV